MSTHLISKHKEAYVICAGECDNKAVKTGSASKKGQRALGEYVEVLEKKKSSAERKKLFQEAMTAWVVEDNVPFNKVLSKALRRMFDMIYDPKEKGEFISTNDTVKKGIVRLGDFVKKATKTSLGAKECSFTTDNWTGPDR